MSAAFESVCEALSLKLVDDAATRLVAQKIIELVQRGVKDVETGDEDGARKRFLRPVRRGGDPPSLAWPRPAGISSGGGRGMPRSAE